MPSFQVLVLGFSVCFLSPFPDSLPTAVPQVLPFCFRFRAFPLSFRFLSSPLVPVLTTQPLFFLSLSSCLRLTVASSALRSHFHSCGLPRSSQPGFPCLVPGSRTRLPVRFLSSLPASLPQLFPRCFPSFPLPLVRFSSGLFRLPFAPFRSLRPASDYSAFRAFLSPLPDLP